MGASSVSGVDDITTLAHRDAVRRGHPPHQLRAVDGQVGAVRQVGDVDAECLGAVGIVQVGVNGERDRRLRLADHVCRRQVRIIGNAGDLHRHGRRHFGDVAECSGRRRRHAEDEIDVGIGRCLDMQVGNLFGRQRDRAVANVEHLAAGGCQDGTVRDISDGDRERFAFDVGQRGIEVERQRMVLETFRIVNVQVGVVGDFDRDIGDRGRGIAVVLRGRRRHRDVEVVTDGSADGLGRVKTFWLGRSDVGWIGSHGFRR